MSAPVFIGGSATVSQPPRPEEFPGGSSNIVRESVISKSISGDCLEVRLRMSYLTLIEFSAQRLGLALNSACLTTKS
jgi:hypothetical protein